MRASIAGLLLTIVAALLAVAVAGAAIGALVWACSFALAVVQ